MRGTEQSSRLLSICLSEVRQVIRTPRLRVYSNCAELTVLGILIGKPKTLKSFKLPTKTINFAHGR
jgi:hypothetical protein